MMKSLLLFAFLLPRLCVAQIDFLASINSSVLVDAARPTGAFFSEGFEGTGYEKGSGAPNGWGEAGTVINEDYTATVLAGAQSLFLDTSGFFYCTNVWAAGAKDVVYGYIMFRLVVSAANSIRVELGRAAVGDDFYAEITNTGGLNKLRVINGTVASGFGSTSILPSNVQTYGLWWEFRRDTDGGAASGVGRAWLSADPAIKGTLECETLVGDCVTQPTTVSLQASLNDQIIFDKLILSDVPIGSNPP